MTTTRSLLRRTLSALSLLATLATPAWAETPPDTIRFGGFGQGFGKPSGLALLAIAHQKSFLADAFAGQPVTLTFDYLTGVGPAINEALANNRLDFAQYGALPNIIGRAAGLPTLVIASYGFTTIYGIARQGTNIQSFSDLKGKRVAVKKGTILHWAFLKALAQHQLTTQDLQVLDLNAADQLAALAAGSIDAAIGSSSLLELRDRGVGTVFYSSKEVPDNQAHGFGAIVVREAFARQYPETTQKVADALVRAAGWLADPGNRDEAYRIWALSGVNIEHLREEYDGVDMAQSFSPRIDDFLRAQYQDAIQFSRDNRLIRNDIDLTTWLVPEYVDTAITRQGLDNTLTRRSRP